jgi:predicted CDP-diglyceride synthetase/phosphatidate cytidylyltransferase
MNYSGLILAVLIGLIVAVAWQRGRKKMNLPIRGKHWWAVVIIVVVLLFLFYGGTHTPHTPTR